MGSCWEKTWAGVGQQASVRCWRSRFLCPALRSLVGFASTASLPLCCMAASPLNPVTSVSNSHVLKRFFHARAMADHEAGGAAGVAAPAEDSSAISILLNYHAATKHHLKRYAKGPHGLDWANKPNPFRRYEGAPVRSLLQLPESPPSVDDPLYSAVFSSSSSSSSSSASSSSSPVSLLNKPLSIASLSQLLYDSLALSAWKSTGRNVRCLRVNPSSGNLHPTEAYIVCDAIDGISASPFVAHYAPKEHALEIRAELPIDVWHGLTQGLPPGSLLLGLTSIFWREAWKYGERAFRSALTTDLLSVSCWQFELQTICICSLCSSLIVTLHGIQADFSRSGLSAIAQ